MKLRMMMDQLQMILEPLSLHFVICVLIFKKSFLGFILFFNIVSIFLKFFS